MASRHDPTIWKCLDAKDTVTVGQRRYHLIITLRYDGIQGPWIPLLILAYC